MKKEALVLSTAEPINDGGRRWNWIYVVSVVVAMVLFIGTFASDFNVDTFVIAIIMGGALGWLVKNAWAKCCTKFLRNTRFVVENKIPYTQLCHELVHRLTPLGMLVEKSSGENRYPIIEYQGAMYDVEYNSDNTFSIWWRQNLVRAYFSFNYIKIYRKEVAAMGIIGYHVQQVCKKNLNQSDDSKSCKVCGSKLLDKAKFCVKCGTAIEREG